MTECIEDGADECLQEGHCAMQANWQVINRAIRAALEGITLRDMAEPLPQELVQLGARRLALRT
jgi:DNA-binding IscR family transcriptional regulator